MLVIPYHGQGVNLPSDVIQRELTTLVAEYSRQHNHGIYYVSNEKVITVEDLISIPFCILEIHGVLTFYSV